MLNINRLDTSSANWQGVSAQEYGQLHEAEKEMFLEVRQFDDGCI